MRRISHIQGWILISITTYLFSLHHPTSHPFPAQRTPPYVQHNLQSGPLYYFCIDSSRRLHSGGIVILKRHNTRKHIKDILFALTVALGLGVLCYILVKYQGYIWTFNSIAT